MENPVKRALLIAASLFVGVPAVLLAVVSILTRVPGTIADVEELASRLQPPPEWVFDPERSYTNPYTIVCGNIDTPCDGDASRQWHSSSIMNLPDMEKIIEHAGFNLTNTENRYHHVSNDWTYTEVLETGNWQDKYVGETIHQGSTYTITVRQRPCEYLTVKPEYCLDIHVAAIRRQ
ncbi:hypothetical protein [Bifidobacterium aquikefiri]|uniref:hypothetical protein n=1 Tax=Bifidobacterium aquikefiri TaxID=1653207 RepID=UPI0023EFDA19|nr:hypothetical protein [Bifidobacterium aquikefiri]